jgi:gamma-glutamylcyclotransferase (GGCT)/AIG2-like uncharacterized protein YtfP
LALNEVFVYGTLKRGLHNNIFLEGAEFVCSSYTMERFELYSDGCIPFITSNINPNILTHRVQGEVYRVDDDTMMELDSLEGNGFFYKRRLIRVQYRKNPCWCYFIMHANSEAAEKRRYVNISLERFHDGTPVTTFQHHRTQQQIQAPKYALS